MRRVLVFCQRKQSSYEAQRVKLTNKTIETQYFKYTDSSEPTKFEFITPCVGTDKGNGLCADYMIEFKMETVKTQEFVEDKKGQYDAIILNTCPFALVASLQNIYGMSKLLKKGGSVYIMAVSNTKDNMIKGDIDRMLSPKDNLKMRQFECYFKREKGGLVFTKLDEPTSKSNLYWAEFVCNIVKNKRFLVLETNLAFVDIVPPYIINLYKSAAEYVLLTNKGDSILAKKVLFLCDCVHLD